MSSVTVAKLEAAKQEEEKGLPISDPAVQTLKKHTHATASRVQGSDQARVRLRSEIWSTTAVLGPPSLWITINPSDLQGTFRLHSPPRPPRSNHSPVTPHRPRMSARCPTHSRALRRRWMGWTSLTSDPIRPAHMGSSNGILTRL